MVAVKKKRKPKPKPKAEPKLKPEPKLNVVASCWVEGCTVEPPQEPCPKHGPKPEVK